MNRMFVLHLWLAVFSGLIAASPILQGAAAADPTEPAGIESYQAMRQCRFSKTAIPLAPGGLTLQRDTAVWHLSNGEVRLMEPLPDGTVTGLSFSGSGRFTMTIPDHREVEQLRRLTGDDRLTKVETTFSELVLRTSESFLANLIQAPRGTGYAPSRAVRRIQDRWLEKQFYDVDARILSGRRSPGDVFLVIDLDSADYGWIRYEDDGQRPEEIQLQKLQKTNDFLETWVSLARARTADGRPDPAVNPVWLDIRRVEIVADLTGKSSKYLKGISRTQPILGKFHTVVTLTADQAEGWRVIPLLLTPLAKVTAVRDESGGDLRFIRCPIGEQFTSVKKEYYDSSLAVLLDSPLEKGSERAIQVDYEMDLVNYATGRQWYPCLRDGFQDLHTARMTVTVPGDVQFRAVGKLIDEQPDGSNKKVTWSIDHPVKMVGFSFGKDFREERISLPETPEVIAFGEEISFTAGNLVRKVAEDVIGSLRFYQDYFGCRIPSERLIVTRIAGMHDQAYEGFIHLSELSWQADRPGASELFRAHEVAHQYWGQMVGWRSYRDQWLSESIAEYAAVLYLESIQRDNRWVEEVLSVSNEELTGSIKMALSKFARPWNIRIPPGERKRIGPVGMGHRASTALYPQAYSVQVYQKGALILHMLRVMLRAQSGSDELFRDCLRDFLTTFTGKNPTTDDFRAAIEQRAGRDLGWFFDQWIDGTAIPTYTWRSTVTSSGDPAAPFQLELTIEQSDVAEGFRMPLPIRCVLPGGTTVDRVVEVTRPSEMFVIPLPGRPVSIAFAPDQAVLAKVISK